MQMYDEKLASVLQPYGISVPQMTIIRLRRFAIEHFSQTPLKYKKCHEIRKVYLL